MYKPGQDQTQDPGNREPDQARNFPAWIDGSGRDHRQQSDDIHPRLPRFDGVGRHHRLGYSQRGQAPAGPSRTLTTVAVVRETRTGN
jgi:hypothetical protein